MIHTDKIRAPEFTQVEYVEPDNDLAGLKQLRLASLLMQYQAATVAYYVHVEMHGDLRRADPYTEDHAAGSDEQREKWTLHAPRQRVLWDRLSAYNGELMRRIYAGKDKAIKLLQAMEAHIVDQVAADGSVPPTDEQVMKEQEKAENPGA